MEEGKQANAKDDGRHDTANGYYGIRERGVVCDAVLQLSTCKPHKSMCMTRGSCLPSAMLGNMFLCTGVTR